MPTPNQIPDAISSAFADRFEDQFSHFLHHDITRTQINAIITEYIGSVEFMKKVREYAGMELDSRMFRSVQYWLTTIITAILTAGIGVLVGYISKS